MIVTAIIASTHVTHSFAGKRRERGREEKVASQLSTYTQSGVYHFLLSVRPIKAVSHV